MHRTALFLLYLLPSSASAQISSGGSPLSATHELSADVPLVVLESPDVARLLAEDGARGEWPLRYGATIDTSLDVNTDGRWDELPGGELVWRIRIASPGARSLGLVFDRFELPEGARLFVYDPARTTVLGAFTAANHQPNGMLAVQPLAGDGLIIEYDQARDGDGRLELSLAQLIHDYRGILGASGQSFSGNCQFDTQCPEAAAYQDIKRAVVMLLNGGGQCSGVVLNNTAEDATPYFYTANHCGNMQNVVAVFGYERPGCGSGTASQANTVSGATLLRASPLFDSQLYQLSAAPPASYAPFYAGWDKRGGPPGPAPNISHPAGQPKKLAVDLQDPQLAGSFWNVDWEFGLIQGGSSGSPLFNGYQRVIGAACCVNNFSCGTQVVSFGRFNGFWNQLDLAPWLDPIGLGVNRVDGFDPFLPIAIPFNGNDVNPTAYTSTSPPAIGQTWTAEIDSSSLPAATLSLIAGFGAPSSGLILAFGELLIDPSSPRHFVSTSAVTGASSQHANPIPNDAALVDFRSYTQGFLVGGGATQATNGVELRLR